MDSEISDNGKNSASLQHVEPSPRLLKEFRHVSSSSVSPSSPLSPTVSASSSATSSSEDLLATADPMEQLDSFLRDALNSRNRITVLRLELEIEKFVRNPRQQQLILNSMPSSYERLVAHRVAQHYHVQSMALESIPPSRILLVKTSDSRVPSVKLADVPIDSKIESKSVTPPPGKLAIKQRSRELGSGSATSGRITPIRSVEERMEEYNKARARIFSSGDIGSRSSEPPALNESTCCSGSERDDCEEDILGKAANTVAVFRDRQKDMKDPDYDRSYDRYSQAMKVASLIPSTTSSVCSSSSYGAGLVTQGGYGQPQRQVYCAASENHGCFWVGAGGVPAVIGYPNVLPSAFHQGFYSRPSNVYNCNQEFTYPRHYSSVDWRQGPTKVEPCSMSSASSTRRF